jgi:hypothetical protein
MWCVTNLAHAETKLLTAVGLSHTFHKAKMAQLCYMYVNSFSVKACVETGWYFEVLVKEGKSGT